MTLLTGEIIAKPQQNRWLNVSFLPSVAESSKIHYADGSSCVLLFALLSYLQADVEQNINYYNHHLHRHNLNHHHHHHHHYYYRTAKATFTLVYLTLVYLEDRFVRNLLITTKNNVYHMQDYIKKMQYISKPQFRTNAFRNCASWLKV